jgi:hypothetical protein
LSCKNQVSSNKENGVFFTEDKINVEENKGIKRRDNKIILVGKILRNKFVEKSKEENKSFII